MCVSSCCSGVVDTPQGDNTLKSCPVQEDTFLSMEESYLFLHVSEETVSNNDRPLDHAAIGLWLQKTLHFSRTWMYFEVHVLLRVSFLFLGFRVKFYFCKAQVIASDVDGGHMLRLFVVMTDKSNCGSSARHPHVGWEACAAGRSLSFYEICDIVCSSRHAHYFEFLIVDGSCGRP